MRARSGSVKSGWGIGNKWAFGLLGVRALESQLTCERSQISRQNTRSANIQRNKRSVNFSSDTVFSRLHYRWNRHSTSANVIDRDRQVCATMIDTHSNNATIHRYRGNYYCCANSGPFHCSRKILLGANWSLFKCASQVRLAIAMVVGENLRQRLEKPIRKWACGWLADDLWEKSILCQYFS